MNIKDFFDAVGGNYEAVITRLPSDSMIVKFVKRFPDDPSFESLKNALSVGDASAAFLAAHTLKGTAANLGFDMLSNAASDITEQLRGANGVPSDIAFKAVEDAYMLTVSKIGQLD